MALPRPSDTGRLIALLHQRLDFIQQSLAACGTEAFAEIREARDVDHDPGKRTNEDATDPTGECVADKPKQELRATTRAITLALFQTEDILRRAEGSLSARLGDMRGPLPTQTPRTTPKDEIEQARQMARKRALVQQYGARTYHQLLELEALTPAERKELAQLAADR